MVDEKEHTKLADIGGFITLLVLLYFWYVASNKLIENPHHSKLLIFFALGILPVVAILIQVTFKKDIEEKIKNLLDSEVRARKEEIVSTCESLLSNLKQSEIPSYENTSEVIEALTDALQELDTIRKKYNPTRGILISTLCMILASIFLVLFYMAPNIMILETNITFAHIGNAFLAGGLWHIVNIFIVLVEEKIWE